MRFRILFALAISTFLVSCKIIKPEVHTVQTYREIVRDTIFKVSGSAVSATLTTGALDSIINRLQRSGGKDTVIYRDRDGKVALKFYMDAFGQLQADCSSKDQQIQALLKDREWTKTETKTEVKREKFVPWYLYAALGALAATAFVLGILYYLTRPRNANKT